MGKLKRPKVYFYDENNYVYNPLSPMAIRRILKRAFRGNI